MTTIRDIAKASGVSVATVSYVLNNGPRNVNPETRDRVRLHMDRLGYQPNAIARSLFTGRTDTVGVVLYTYGATNPVASPYFGQILGGILDSAARLRKSTMLNLEPITEGSTQHINKYCDGRIDGLLFIAPPDTAKVVHAMRGRRTPYILVNDSYPDPDVSTIDIDNAAGAKAMTQYLISKGHRRIAFMNGDIRLDSAASRDSGYRQALCEAGLEFDASLDVKGEYIETSGYRRALSLFSQPRDSRPTACFCGSDQIALGVLRAARELDLRIPEELSVAGFDDIPNASESHPALTTVRQPLYHIGMQAVDMLFDLLDGAAPHKRVIDTELIERDSVCELK